MINLTITLCDIKHEKRLSKEDNIDNLVAPYISLPDDFDAYLAAHMSAKTRQKLRRFTRKVTNSQELKITHTNTETCERDLAALGDLWTTKWSQRKVDNVTRLASTYKRILRQALHANMLYMPVLWREDEPIGVLGSLIDWQKKTLLFFVAGRDESCANLPTGLLLHGHSIRWAIEHGLKTYDFLAGNEPYKYSYGVQEQRLQCITLSTKSKANLNDILDPRCIEAAFKKAILSHREQRLRQAKSGYRQVLQVRPDDLKVLERYARLLTETGDHPGALKIHQRVTSKHPDNVIAWICVGKSYFSMDAYQNACLALERAVELSSNKSIKALYYLGRAQLSLDRRTAATTSFHAVLKLVPESKRGEKRQLKARQYLQM